MVLLRLSESNSVNNHISDSKNRTTSKRETDLLITSVITDRIRRYEVLLSIIQNYDKLEKETSRHLYIFIERKQQLTWERRDNSMRTWQVLSTYTNVTC